MRRSLGWLLLLIAGSCGVDELRREPDASSGGGAGAGGAGGAEDAGDASAEDVSSSGGASGVAGADGSSLDADAASSIAVSAEQTVGSVELSLATASQRLVEVVARPGEYLALHGDERFGSAWYATRIAANGGGIEPKGVRLLEPSDDSYMEDPDVAAGPSGYAISSAKCTTECEVVLTYLDASGPTLSLKKTVLEKSAGHYMAGARVARTEQGFVVVWTRWAKPAYPPSDGGTSSGPPPEARALRLGPNGQAIDGAPTTFASVSTGELVETGSTLMMFGRSGSSFFAAPLITSPAVALGQQAVLAQGQVFQPQAVWGGGVAAAVWLDVTGIRLGRASSAGVSLDDPPKLVAPISTPYAKLNLDVSFASDAFRVTWSENDALNGQHTRVAQVSPSGAVGAPSVAAASTLQLLWTSDGAGVRAFGTTAIPISRLATAPDGPLPLALTPVTEVANAQEDVTLWASPTDISSAWIEKHDDLARVAVTRGPSLASPTSLNWLGSRARDSALARGTSQTLVAWVETVDPSWRTRAVRLSPTGEVLDPNPITLPQSEGGQTRCDFHNAVAASDTGFLVFRYSELCVSGYWTPYVCAVGLTTNAAVSDLGCDKGWEPAAIGLPSGFFAAWRSHTEWALVGKRIDPSTGLAGAAAYTYPTGRDPSLATDGKYVLTAYRNIESMDAQTGKESKVFAALHDAASGAEVKSPFQVSEDNDATDIHAVYDAAKSSYWIVWRRWPSSEVRVARLDASGAVVTTPETAFTIAHFAGGISATPQVSGELLLGYARFDETLGSTRVGIRTLIPSQ